MRIIAGTARGVRLAPVPEGVRPTSDRVRESVFNSLGQFFDGGTVLDLYAGSGALGIEALSRGCESAVFVERDRRVAAVIRENLRKARLEGRGEIIVGDVENTVESLLSGGKQFNLIFADPPYRIAATEVGEILLRLRSALFSGGRIVVESGSPIADIENMADMRGVERRFGGTFVTVFEKDEEIVETAVCPGSFDPLTVGHLDVIERASRLFEHVVVAVGRNVRKDATRLSAEERAALVERAVSDFDNVSVEMMSGLLVDFAREQGARVVIKGLRAISDFESEFVQAQMNRRLYPEFETVFIMSDAEHSFLSSSLVREIAAHDGEVRGLVPDTILESVRQIYAGMDDRI
ncbi:MAG: pantetheine-phosphate adenylyltransferase [Actinomycetota bacterium]|jgi:pantetheine-phosphate adenylyltransferase|nr:pantetheine-phosphate adenylyltransferase [Rubrobacter sp.]MDQ3507546.1 pantetheine-phosphate adenylyltransferase [Actinomycetota bacterium]